MPRRLSQKHGVAPVLTVCPVCGKDTNELQLLGASADKVMRKLYEATDGKMGSREGYTGSSTQKTIASEPCDECKARQKDADDEVKRGGVYWKCTRCGSTGAIKAEHELSKAVRKQMNIEAPDPCGVDLTGQCPVCDQQAE